MAENFKVGDKVELTEDYDNFEKGTQGTVTEIVPSTTYGELLRVETTDGDGDNLAAFSYRSKKIGDAAPTYKVGQKVRITQDTSAHRRSVGDTVTLQDDDTANRGQWRIAEAHADTGYRPWVSLSDFEPVEEVDIDVATGYPQVGDEVTLRYVPTGEEVVGKVHEGDFGLMVLGWTLLREHTYAEQDLEDIEVTAVLRKATPEPEDPSADNYVPGTILKGSPSHGSGPTYLFKVREGYEEKQWNDTVAEWRAFYDDGSTGMWTWEDIQSGLFGETEVFQVGEN